MKITFAIPNIEISGGVKAVFEFANHLSDRGHEVVVLCPLALSYSRFQTAIMPLVQAVRNPGTKGKSHTSPDWFCLRADLRIVPNLKEKYVPDGDIIVATWWETAYPISRLSPRKGHKFYLAQHYEVWGGPKEKVDRSYSLGLKIIVNSTWLKNILGRDLGVAVDSLIFHAPDLEQFYPENRGRVAAPIRVLMPHRSLPWKGVADGVTAFAMAKKKYPNTQLVMFGLEHGDDVPPETEFHERPTGDRLREIYNSCHVFLFPSHAEGFGMPPMEAMLCKCAVVTTDVGAVRDYAIRGKTALISPPQSPKLLGDNLIRLLEDDDLRSRLSEEAFRHVRRHFSWEKAASQIEKRFSNALEEGDIQGKGCDQY